MAVQSKYVRRIVITEDAPTPVQIQPITEPAFKGLDHALLVLGTDRGRPTVSTLTELKPSAYNRDRISTVSGSAVSRLLITVLR
jgi:hypothetical protein